MRHAHLLGLGLLIGATQVSAQGIPVIDAASIVKQVQAANLMLQQLGQLERQVSQLEATYRSVTGQRGLATLLDDQSLQLARHFVPDELSTLNNLATESTSTGFIGLQQRIAQLAKLVSTLPPGYFAAGSAALAELQANTARLATQQATAEASFGASAAHLPNIEQMLQAAAATSDSKGIGEIQARLQAEQGFIAVEQSRLSALLYEQNAQSGIRAQQEDDALRQAGRRNQSPVSF
jgi:type IV secretion system protein VirB5